MKSRPQQEHLWRRISQRLERVLWVLAMVVFVYGAFVAFEALDGRAGAANVGAQTSSSAADGPIVPDAAVGPMYAGSDLQPPDDGSVMGTLKIPAIHLDVPITTGITKLDLLRGAGHVPGSAMPGGLGNMAIAGHRDTYFRPLRNVAAGMIVLVNDRSGTFKYSVDRYKVVTPDEVNVLDIGAQPQLTMVTCYPFNYIGAAPKRFVVYAHLVSLLPLDRRP